MKTKKTELVKDDFVWGGIHPFSHHPFIFHLIPDIRDKKILDCGCGKGIWGFLMRAVRGTKGSYFIGIDTNNDYLRFCKKYNIYDRLLNADISKLPLKDESVDFLICSEVIEHLSDKKAKRFLAEVDRVARPGARAIITTPNVLMATEIAEGADAHHSLCSPEMFRKNGYKVYGIGIKLSPGIHQWFTPYVLGLSYVFTPISHFIPKLGAYLIAVKDF